MKCYYGEIHSHTVESDGKGTPEEAYDYARDVGKVDFFAVTDHHQHLATDRFADQMPTLAREKSQDGKFAALYGYEMSYSANTGYYGHLNLYGEPYVHPKTVPLGQWYDRIAESGRAITGQFNHPGEKWGDFDEFAYDARIDRIFDLIELRIDEYGIPVIEEEYERCLSKGWHVGPLSNEDTHGGDFTTAREEVGAVLAEELSIASITDAMKHRRTFATTDGTFQIFYRANGHWMGDILEKTGVLDISVECSTEKDCGIGVLQLVGERNTVLNQIDAARAKHFTWNVRLPDGHKYVYVRRMCGTHYAVTAPVWVEQPPIVALFVKTSFGKDGTSVQAEINNISGRDIEAINIDYYACGGRITYKQRPSRRIQASLSAVSSSLSDCFVQRLGASQDRVTVAVSGICDGVPFYLSKVVYVCPIGITQVFVNTIKDIRETSEESRVEQFNCFDLHNFSDAECDLSDYTIRTYPLHIPRYDDVIICRTLAPHGTLTVYFHHCEVLV